MIVSRLTAKAQTTIPRPVRLALGLAPGDSLSYEIGEDRVVLRRHVARAEASPGNLPGSLAEWDDPANDLFDRL